MGCMSVEVPERKELLRLVDVARYGDAWCPDSSGSDGMRGGALHLSAVLPALSCAIGHPVATAVHHDPAAVQRALGIPDADSAIVVLIDGLGYWNLQLRLGHAPYLRSLMGEPVNQRPISTCAPSTTAAAMATFGTGTCPGLTGMTGYTQRNPETGEMAQLIQFRNSISPLYLQRQPTVFESLAARGVRVTSSGLPKFEDSALTRAALRGADYRSGSAPRDLVRVACSAAGEPGLTYLYLRDIDKIGHNYGWNSDRWVAAFERIDAQLGALRRMAPSGTLIVIVADHGMVSSSVGQRVDIARVPELADGVGLVGGEPRSVMLYAKDGVDPADIVRRWRGFFGTRALVRTRQEAVAQGVFGPVEARVLPMIGDVLVSAGESDDGESVTVVDTRSQTDKATRLPSVHGSQSMMEMDIPCLIDIA